MISFCLVASASSEFMVQKITRYFQWSLNLCLKHNFHKAMHKSPVTNLCELWAFVFAVLLGKYLVSDCSSDHRVNAACILTVDLWCRFLAV